MRVLIVDAYYPSFLDGHYAASAGLSEQRYDVQHAALMARSMGTSDAYSTALRALGHDAREIVVNCKPLQLRWARENGIRMPLRRLALSVPTGRARAAVEDRLLRSITRAQIDAYRPDVVYTQVLSYFEPGEIEQLRARGILVAAQCGSQPPPAAHVAAYDLVATSFPHFVPRLRALGIDTEYLPLAFDERVLGRLRSAGANPAPEADRPTPVAFVGGVHRPSVHRGGTALLERMCETVDMQVWGYIDDDLAAGSPVRARYHGQAWGLEMYRVLADSRIAINRHGDIAETFANNMRLFEATGVGALLFTEAADNLHELFEPGLEVVAYRDADELVAQVRQYLADDEARIRVARAGQQATLGRHTYAHRMSALAEMLERRIRAQPTSKRAPMLSSAPRSRS